MNGQQLKLWILIIALLLQCGKSIAQEQEVETETELETTAGLDVDTTNVMASEAAPIEQTSSIDSVTEQHATASSVMAMETKAPETDEALPTTALTVEETHAPDYQDDAPLPHVATTEETQLTTAPATQSTTAAATHPTTAAEVAKPAVDSEFDSKPVNKTMSTLSHGCFSCSSYHNGTCVQQPTERLQCPVINNRSGCYTLLKRDTKLITRGCISELKENDINYCRKEKKLCMMCYEILCNKELAPNAGDVHLLSSFTFWSFCIVALLSLV